MQTALLLLTLSIDAEGVEFNEDVRPILSNHCYACHGPDAEARQSGLRFDTGDSALRPAESGETAVVAGDPNASELIARVHSDDEFVVMPPPETNNPLTAEQIDILTRWIEQGGEFERHWSLVPPTKTEPPAAPSDVRSSNVVDQFIAAKYAEEGLAQNPPADKRTLVRRVYLDLTGLPPTPAEVEAFVSNDSPDAYEEVVDQLLASPRYGEHMTRYWLDLVRYADTHGMHFDNYREMWPYRDWVTRSFNENKPYSEFVAEQLAGDLMNNGDPTREQLVASGFNRLNMTTNEGGSIYDEVFMRNVIDRTEAFGTVFLGLTAGCAQCHDHKFDPISQKDFYSLYAFFNSLDGRAMDGNRKDHEPYITVPTAEQEAELAVLAANEDRAAEALASDNAAVDEAQAEWVASLAEPQDAFRKPSWSTLVIKSVETSAGELKTEDGVIRSTGNAPDKADYTIELALPEGETRAVRLHALPEGTNKRVGRSPNGNVVVTEIELTHIAADGTETPVEAIAPSADHTQDGEQFAVANAFDGKLQPGDRGWALAGHQKDGGRVLTMPLDRALTGGSLRVVLKQQSVYGAHVLAAIKFDASPVAPSKAPITSTPWHLAGPFAADNVRSAIRRRASQEGRKFEPSKPVRFDTTDAPWVERLDFTDGLVHSSPAIEDSVLAYLLHRTLKTPVAQTVTALIDTPGGVQVFLNGKQITRRERGATFRPLSTAYDLPLKEGENALYVKLADRPSDQSVQFTFAIRSPQTRPTGSLATVAALSADERPKNDAANLRRFYRRVVADGAEALKLRGNLQAAIAKTDKYRSSLPVSLVYRETEEPRTATVMLRGEYDQPGDPVTRRVPESLPPLPEGVPRDRLGLAMWLLQDDHPLTSRVAVNRFWQQLFGTGLVKTSEDLGSQGEPPTHPELLDWLAVDFRENGWDVKRLMKQLVMSETYRQSSTVDPAERKADPENRYLARGPRHRLDAETLRDQALYVSGLLNDEMGGPSIKPPQPDGLWKAVAYVGSDTGNFRPSKGDDIYRRSLYIFWKRTAHAPMMGTLDAPNRESCTARRERTNTPLQALLLLNEEMFVEAARNLAQQAMTAQSADAARIGAMFLRTTGRPPSKAEETELTSLLSDARTLLKASPEEAASLLKIGQSPVDESLDAAELAAFTVVANTLLNLDEVVSKR